MTSPMESQPMSRSPSDTSQVTLRLSNEMLRRIDEEATKLSKSGYQPERTEVMRIALAHGLEHLKAARERDSTTTREYDQLLEAGKTVIALARRAEPPTGVKLVGELTLDDLVDTLTLDDPTTRRWANTVRIQARVVTELLRQFAARRRRPDEKYRHEVAELERLVMLMTGDIAKAMRRPSGS